MHGVIEENIFFLHIPKCGGQSIDKAIRTRYQSFIPGKSSNIASLDPIASANAANIINKINFPHDTSDDYPIQKLREDLLIYFMNQKNIKFVSGHFTFSQLCFNNYSNKFKFITVLRDPVQRLISIYFFNKNKADHHCRITDDDIEAFLSSERGISQGHAYVKFIGGLDSKNDYISRTAIDRAKMNLDKFEIVGGLEYLDKFLDRFEDKFRVRLNVQHLNKNPKSKQIINSVITEEIKDKIREICKPDLEIYQYAVEKFAGNDS